MFVKFEIVLVIFAVSEAKCFLLLQSEAAL